MSDDTIYRQSAIDVLHGYFDGMLETDTVCPADIYGLFECIPSAQPEQSSEIQNILKYLDTVLHPIVSPDHWIVYSELHDMISMLPYAQPEPEKYEYHYDHTDCIWYRPEARNRCPVTCAQYRDGWNDAMNYIFRDGKGYRPYRRDEQYGE